VRIPLCPYFGKCGGCAAQHIEYEDQLLNKKQALASVIGSEDIQVFSDREYFYRNRMDMAFHPEGIGFRKKGDWKVIVPVERCAISNERLNELVAEITIFFKKPIDAFYAVKRIGTFCYAVIRTPAENSSIAFVLNKDSTHVDEALLQIKAFAAKTSADTVLVVYINSKSGFSISDDYFVVKGEDQLKITYLGTPFVFSVQGFFQNNDVMAEKMHQYVHDLLKTYDTSSGHLLDLYGGVGTFGILNASLFKSVTTVESFEGCVEAARKNITLNEVPNIEAILLDAKNLKKLTFPKPLFVLTDPPRSGMHPKTIQHLQELRPKVIVYVSCNVDQLGRDLPKFKNYYLKSAALFDLFPQTNHMESVIELRIKNQ